jgi:hypothetical protein
VTLLLYGALIAKLKHENLTFREFSSNFPLASAKLREKISTANTEVSKQLISDNKLRTTYMLFLVYGAA